MKTTFSSLLEHIETFPVNAEVNKKEEELYCATAFITLLQSGLLTQDVDESGDGLTKKQDVLLGETYRFWICKILEPISS